MARDLSTGFEDGIQERVKNAAIFCELVLDDTALRLWTGIGLKAFGPESPQNLFTGAGAIMSFSEVRETQLVQAQGLNVSLSGLQSNLISVALSEDIQGRPFRMWWALLDNSGDVVADYLLFEGKADVFEIETSGDTATMRLSLETELIDLLKPRERNLTPEDQKRDYPSDLGLDFIPFIQDAEIVWGPKG